ncbi:Peroxin-3-domain-containing protein [Amniculicola lignicola CBS 123094]|uniref:Peroxin-3-domain-containing protein n=1 Tax=Amniculicola lignicola CBS 123094 TaxID=1392246 RepID=A0A6A5X1C8_9PLEO|nr:Peroxin-3-domain-containing protein [Amniculicola lignicola CBS 123094]
MIAASRRWFKRNRTNFAIGAGVLGAGYLAGQYALGKLSEARQRMSDERIAKENLRRRFEQNQEDCTFTVLAILPTATENILDAIPVEQILEELQKQKSERLARSVGPSEIASSAPPSVADDDGKSLTSFQSEGYVHASQVGDGDSGSAEGGAEATAQSSPPPKSKKTKAQLWNEMKISSISRAFTLLYTLSLLTLLTRIQLNLLGRRNYLASVVSLASPQTQESRINLENHDDDNYEHAYGNDFETNRRYLSFSWWLLHRGCIQLMHKVTAAVSEVFGSLNPREEITLEKLSELTLEVRRKVEGATEEERRTCKWLPFLLPTPSQESYVLRESGMTTPTSAPPSPSLRRLIDETSDLIDSPSFTHVLTLLLDAAFSHLIDTKISQLAYKIPPTSASTARIQELVGTDVKAKVANSLAVFCRQAHAIGTGANNEYLVAIEGVRDLEAFAAVVYSSNFEFEGPEVGGAGASAAPAPVVVGEEVVPTATAPVPVPVPVPATALASAPAPAPAPASGVTVADIAVAEEVHVPEAEVKPVVEDEEKPVEEKDGEVAGELEESAVEVAKEAGFESAWGKALAKEDGKST